MNTLKRTAITLVSGLCLTGTSASAQGIFGLYPQGFYADGGYSFLDFEVSDESGEAELSVSAITLRGGMRLNEVLGVELEGSFGVGDDNAELDLRTDVFGEDFNGTIDVSAELESQFAAYGVAHYPLNENFNLFARAGYVQASVDVGAAFDEGVFGEDFRFDTGRDDDDTERGVALGVGATFTLDQRIYARGDYTRYDLDDVDADTFTIGGGYRF